MKPTEVSTRRSILSHHPQQCVQPQALPKPATATKEEIRGWRKSRPLSVDEHTRLSINMWNRALFPQDSNNEHQALQPGTRQSDNEDTTLNSLARESSDLIASPPLLATTTSSSLRHESTALVMPYQTCAKDSESDVEEARGTARTSTSMTNTVLTSMEDDALDAAMNLSEALSQQLDGKTGQDFWGPVVAFLRGAS